MFIGQSDGTFVFGLTGMVECIGGGGVDDDEEDIDDDIGVVQLVST